MNKAQNPLTGTPAPALDWSRDGTPASTSFDDIYFSVDGGLEETENVFLKGNDLPNRWLGCETFCIGELGFGSGLNFLACWNLWQDTARPDARLHFISIEAYPWSADDLRKALNHFPELADYAEPLINQWPGQVKGMHRLHFGKVNLTLIHMDVERALAQYQGPDIDAWFLDGFSPAKNPDMWSPAVLEALGKLSADSATIGTFTVAGDVRRGLQKAGFAVERKPGFGRKRHRLEARYIKTAKEKPDHVIDSAPIIIGAGIAGASIAHAFSRRGINPVLIDPAPDLSNAASGNPAALVMPRLDLQDRPESRFFLNAYLYAVQLYEKDGDTLQTGAVHLAKSSDEQNRFEKIAAQAALPASDMQLISKEEVEQYLNLTITPPYSGLKFPHALTIDPLETITSFTAKCTKICKKATNIVRKGNDWTVLDDNEDELARSSVIFITSGADLKAISGINELPVRFTRGQIVWGESEVVPGQPITYGGYALKYANGLMLGATHEHVECGQLTDVRTEDDDENIKNFEALTGQSVPLSQTKSRAAVRVTTKDTLPISTEIEPGLFVMTGLGSRGFMMAPLLGEALVCEVLGEPLPITRLTKMRFGTREKI
ncbi:MAG: FAD-dependent oxidoreductase [Acidimicrobiales bacterium]|nr:tRNA (5-methylaminomethyl-2-thiouridine)(34)-methyltransferase MnmD [Hyphomonadaceae bacterium]RZV44967.1 MAG: FAD-dependent oxidoreductase [Acidimicrobiales bacterium]